MLRDACFILTLYVCLHTCLAGSARNVQTMITQENGAQLAQNKFEVGSAITITCHLKLFGGPMTLPSDFDVDYNAVSRVSLLRIPLNGVDEEKLATYNRFHTFRNNTVKHVIASTWTYTFGDEPTLNIRDGAGSADTMSIALKISKTKCSDQADYICRFLYVDKDNKVGTADFNQTIATEGCKKNKFKMTTPRHVPTTLFPTVTDTPWPVTALTPRPRLTLASRWSSYPIGSKIIANTGMRLICQDGNPVDGEEYIMYKEDSALKRPVVVAQWSSPVVVILPLQPWIAGVYSCKIKRGGKWGPVSKAVPITVN